ncbi:MAG TPA: response regulator [Kofleriaceae bacterium]|nr:response regulator [Kofleriaceae bacterium]
MDDSSSIRSIVGKALRDLGFDIEQAEDGEEGLALLRHTKVDLILLDVTMPVMDGPTMLKALRERGDRTPVIMLTSESKRAVVAGAMQLGIDDYMLKPFKPDELRTKVFKALRMSEPAAQAMHAAQAVHAAHAPTAAKADVVAAASAAPGAAPAAGKAFVDILIVDDMENVHKRFRQALPQQLTLQGAANARAALAECQARVFRVILIDLVIPDVNSVALMNQLRALQPHAAFVALVLRSTTDPRAEVTGAGFADYLFKPFEADAITELLGRFFDAGTLLEIDDTVMTAIGFEGKEDKVDRYYHRLRTAIKEATEKLAAACYDEAIFDMRALPLRADKTIRMIIDIEKDARRFGLAFKLVGTPEAGALLRRVTDTATLPFFDTPAAALGKAA